MEYTRLQVGRSGCEKAISLSCVLISGVCTCNVPLQTERLDCQKKLLINQVLKLELKLKESQEAKRRLEEKLEGVVKRAEAAESEKASLQV